MELSGRGLISLSGADTRLFLQALVTNDVDAVGPDRAIYSALLSAQGKYLHDFFVFELSGTLYLDCEAAQIADIIKLLSMYRLRAVVDIADAGGQFAVYAVPGAGAEKLVPAAAPGSAAPFQDGIVYRDPRLAEAGARCALPVAKALAAFEGAGLKPSDPADYERFRLGLGLPDGSRDMAVDRALPLESGLSDLNGIDFEKGCFIGQEVTTRMHHRGLVRKRLLPVEIYGTAPAPGIKVMQGNVEAGEITSSTGDSGLALLRLDMVADDEVTDGGLTADGAKIKPRKPGWVNF